MLDVIRGEDGIATIVFERPEQRNAFDWQMLRKFGEAIDEIEADPNLRVVLLVSALDRVFVAGGDIAVMRDLDFAQGFSFVTAGQELFRRLEESRLVFIAVVDGYALGGGFELALACDLVVAGPGAVFGMPETTIGLLPGWGGTQRLVRAVSPQRARELVYTGRRLSADEAQSLGLITVLVDDGAALAAEALAAAVVKASPTAVAQAKRALNDGASLPFAEALAVEARAWMENLASVNRVEGLSAFLEKRAPRFVTQEVAGSEERAEA